jgi:hypothetical protein
MCQCEYLLCNSNHVSTLKMDVTGFFETLVFVYKTILCQILVAGVRTSSLTNNELTLRNIQFRMFRLHISSLNST